MIMPRRISFLYEWALYNDKSWLIELDSAQVNQLSVKNEELQSQLTNNFYVQIILLGILLSN